ncbi:MAG: chorismate-binding protein [Phycisphaerales bacterium]
MLARRRRYRASAALEPVGILARLGARESRGFRFLVEVAPGRAFLGVTPERLVSRAGGNARSEAVAGTRPRGVDAHAGSRGCARSKGMATNHAAAVPDAPGKSCCAHAACDPSSSAAAIPIPASSRRPCRSRK